MATIKNKEILQSYILTTAHYDFSASEKRILYRIVEILQAQLEGKRLSYKYSIQKTMIGDEFTIPIKCFLRDDTDTNYQQVKKALRDLRNKDFEYEDASEWGVYGIIEMPKFKKYDSNVKITITPLLLEAFMNFAKGYRKYELTTAMKFESIYSMRFYELMSGQTNPLPYTIETLKSMFKIENKYKRINDFIRKVVEPAKKELDEKSPYSFDYKINKQGRKYHSITFFPKIKPEHQDELLEQRKLQQKLSLRWSLPVQAINYLKDVYGFSTKEITAHIEPLKLYALRHDLVAKLAYLQRYAESKSNPKGYIINAIKKELAQ